MPSEQITFSGIYLPIFLAYLAATAIIYLALRLVLLRLRVYRFFWHPALAGAGLFVILLAGVMLLFGP